MVFHMYVFFQYSANHDIQRTLKDLKTLYFPHSSFFTLHIFHFSFVPHSAISTLHIFRTPQFAHSPICAFPNLCIPQFLHSPISALPFSSLTIFYTPQFPHSALLVFHTTTKTSLDRLIPQRRFIYFQIVVALITRIQILP